MNRVTRFFRHTRTTVQRGFFNVKTAYLAAVAASFAMLLGAFPAAAATPGAAIAGALSGGSTQIMAIIGAVAILLGLIILWAYVKRAR